MKTAVPVSPLPALAVEDREGDEGCFDAGGVPAWPVDRGSWYAIAVAL